MNFKKKWQEHRSFILFVILLFAFRWSFFDHYRVPTSSLYPSVHVGDQLLVSKMAYDLKIPYTEISIYQFGDPQRGDIVVFEYPIEYDRVNQEYPADGLWGSIENYFIKLYKVPNYVKRLIAVPGDKVEVSNGFVKVNGESLLLNPDQYDQVIKDLSSRESEFQYQEKHNGHVYSVNRTPGVPQFYEPMSFEVPEGQYFVMGDNRDQSSDSRAWGFVPRSYFKGRALRVLLSVTLTRDFIKWERTGKKLD